MSVSKIFAHFTEIHICITAAERQYVINYINRKMKCVFLCCEIRTSIK